MLMQTKIWQKIQQIYNDFNNLPIRLRRNLIWSVYIITCIILIGIGWRLIELFHLRKTTEQQAILNVAIAQPLQGAKLEEVILPGEVRAWHEATIYARTNGYIQAWYVDIGAKVKKGDLLAKIEGPDIDAQLLQAEANLKTSQANNTLAQSTHERWQNLLKTGSVSKHGADEKASNVAASNATVSAAQANVKYLDELVDFQQITAPFNGTITARNIDIGTLIDEGSNNTLTPLFHIIQADKLRVYVRVPQNYAPRITPAMEVKLTFTEYPGKSYAAKLLSTAKSIDPITRTLLTEFEVNNEEYGLLPGGYTQVHLLLPSPDYIVRVPVNTLLFRAEGLQVASVDKNNIVKLLRITVGRDFGNELEVVAGLLPQQSIILNPPESLLNGQKINVVHDASSRKE